MNIRESSELMKKYNNCPECGSDNIGGEPSQGALIIQDEVFTRSCKCGWSVTVDRRIKCVAYMTCKRNRKSDGIYEVSIHGRGHKYLPLNELKEKANVRSVNQSSKIENWLNTREGRNWALEVSPASIY